MPMRKRFRACLPDTRGNAYLGGQPAEGRVCLRSAGAAVLRIYLQFNRDFTRVVGRFTDGRYYVGRVVRGPPE
ncbi:MAG: hypothetical protein JXR37_15825 [Kiritimatiellae bacterium]|nr:hypothetical protein [Kiritimatiellia bacterium]